MLQLWFEGWFQMRMATDPDPTDEPRGLSGYTFALPGEPDFDGLLHFSPDEPGVCERAFGPAGTPGPRVGVTVRRAERFGQPVPELVGAPIQFVDAQLVERNGLVVRNDFFAIDPLRVRLTVGCVWALERTDLLDPDDPSRTIVDATAAMLERRQPRAWARNSEEVARATGLPTPVTNEVLLANRRQRQRNLEALLQQTTDPAAREGLITRIRELDSLEQWWNRSDGTPIDRRAYTLALQAKGWDIPMMGPVGVNRVGADPSRPWPVAFWLGGWDGDALCGYVQGTWQVPLVAEQRGKPWALVE